VDPIKISQLPPIGNTIPGNTLVPVVNMTGTPDTQKATIANIANAVLSQAGNLYISAGQANVANFAGQAGSVSNSMQPNITSVGILSNLTVEGLVNLGNVSNLVIYGGSNNQVLTTDGNGVVFWDDGGTYGNSEVANYLPTFTGNVGANWVIADYFMGNAHNLTFIPGANINGAVPYASTANSVALGNVSGIGNIANINLDGSSSNILYGNGVFAAAPSGGGLPLANGNSNFDIATADGNATITTNGSSTWTFDGNGLLTLPGGYTKIGAQYGSEAILASNASFGVATQGNATTYMNWSDDVANTSVMAAIYVNAPNATPGDIHIRTGNIGTPNFWKFNVDGNLVLPNGNSVIQSIANSSLDPLIPNVSTMTLTPDSNYTSQVLVLDPTAPGHIHLRAYAFSNIDEPAANIFLGGENTAFEITQGANNVAKIHSGGNTWTFTNAGDLQLASGNSVISSLPNNAGDSSGLSTLNLYPDNSTGDDRYLIIDPTGPAHLHLRAGGAQDASNVLLYLGGEQTYVQIDDGYHRVSINSYDVGNATGYNWRFDYDGTVIFPTLTVDLHNGGNQSAQTLQFGDQSQQVIITGPTPDVDTNAQRLIIQGQRGNGLGEGGDVYFWAGDADTNGGDIKIYAGDADNVSAGYGGYINLDGGSGYDGGGQISVTGGYSANGPGGTVNISAGQGGTDGGAININGGGATANQGGNIALQGGYGGNNGGEVRLTGGSAGTGIPGYGNVVLVSGASTWTFDNTGNMVVPSGLGRFIKSTPGGYLGLATIDDGTDVPAQLLSVPANAATGTTAISAYANSAMIQANINGSIQTWNFDNTGNLTLPGNTFAVNYANGTQVSLGGGSYGDSNVVTLLGSFGSNSISTTGNVTANNFSGNTNSYTIGYLDIPQIPASNTTLAATDGGKHYYSTTAGNLTLTIPNNATTSFATGTAISIVVQAAGNVLVNAASGVTLYMAGSSSAGNRVVGTYGMATLMKVASDTWFINGTGVY
jgi:hypothetical protein